MRGDFLKRSMTTASMLTAKNEVYVTKEKWKYHCDLLNHFSMLVVQSALPVEGFQNSRSICLGNSFSYFVLIKHTVCCIVCITMLILVFIGPYPWIIFYIYQRKRHNNLLHMKRPEWVLDLYCTHQQ